MPGEKKKKKPLNLYLILKRNLLFPLKYLLISRSVYTPAVLRSHSQEGKFLCGVLEAVEQILCKFFASEQIL